MKSELALKHVKRCVLMAQAYTDENGEPAVVDVVEDRRFVMLDLPAGQEGNAAESEASANAAEHSASVDTQSRVSHG